MATRWRLIEIVKSDNAPCIPLVPIITQNELKFIFEEKPTSQMDPYLVKCIKNRETPEIRFFCNFKNIFLLKIEFVANWTQCVFYIYAGIGTS